MTFEDHLARADAAAKGILGTDVLYTPESGAAVTVAGIFEPKHAKQNGPSPLDIGGWGPAVLLTIADLPSDPKTDNPTITIDGTSYTVHEAVPAGPGEILVFLNAVEA